MSMVTVSPFVFPHIINRVGSSQLLDAVNEFAFIIISVPKTGTLNKIGWQSGTTTGASYTLKISLETVASATGAPCATTNAGKTLYATGAESSDITSITSNTVYYTPINGTTGIEVTKGDLICVTFRLTAVSGSSINIKSAGTVAGGEFSTGSSGTLYNGAYLGGSWSLSAIFGAIALVYSTGICPTPYTFAPVSSSDATYNSGSDPNHIGIKFRYPIKCRLYSAHFYLNLATDCDIILYDSDEYTPFTGFPITLTYTQKRLANNSMIQVVFPTQPTIEANTDYRLIIVPKSSTNITLSKSTYYPDGSDSGLNTNPEGTNIVYTSRNGAPSSGDHAWTDSTTDRPNIILVLDGIEVSAGGSGGISRSRQLMG